MTEPGVAPFFRDVARVALTVADKHGFVLGGGVAWVINGLVQRPTEDVDLFTDTAGAAAAAAEEVVASLRAAGFQVEEEGPLPRPARGHPFCLVRSVIPANRTFACGLHRLAPNVVPKERTFTYW
jgi:hypothetical protein